jgi:hypothetical protein
MSAGSSANPNCGYVFILDIVCIGLINDIIHMLMVCICILNMM